MTEHISSTASADPTMPVDAPDGTHAAGTPAATVPAPATAPAPAGPPSVHIRAIVTWLAIFPMVSVGMLLLAPVSESWHPVLRALALTVVVVPLAVYLVVPQLLRAHGALRRR